MKDKQLSVFATVMIDLFFIAFGLIVFALFHHVLVFNGNDTAPQVITTPAAFQANAAETVSDTQSTDNSLLPNETHEEVVYAPGPESIRAKFAEKFTDGEVILTDTSYQSSDIAIFVEHVEDDGFVYNIADIYLTDIYKLKTAFGRGTYHKTTEDALAIARNNDAILAISGDHYGARQEGIVLRNGILYRDTLYEDLCIIDTSGVMTTIEAPYDDTILETITDMSPWQVWSFGPALLDSDGNAKTVFNSSVKPRNPRTAIGYYEPGHYVFLEVDGRSDNASGMSMIELSVFFHSLGCTAAYNLDGGGTSNFIWNGNRLSYPYGRTTWDIVYIGE